uniref:Probable RNA polymerase II nuclear localization protein SLC7A6OS n=1 Tax=Plectus sambesii TaxID=2011161 RepID=A0A914VSY3_9BILA
MANAVIRIRRKRSADPHSALLLSFKRQRTDAAGENRLLYRLAGTANESDVRGEIEKLARSSQLSSIALADLDTEQGTVSTVESIDLGELPEAVEETEDAHPLACLNDAVGEVGGVPLPTIDNAQSSSITCNGTPLIRVQSTTTPADDDFVYDLYVKKKVEAADAASIPPEYFADLVDVRFLNAQQELVFVDEDDEDGDESIPDDEDSNDEGNARNDYPDEEDEDEENDSDEDDDVLAERFHRIGFQDGSFEEFGDDSDCD